MKKNPRPHPPSSFQDNLLEPCFHFFFTPGYFVSHFVVLDYYMALQDDHIESDEELPKKTKCYFANAAETFDAEFYAKVNDDIYINVGKYHLLTFIMSVQFCGINDTPSSSK